MDEDGQWAGRVCLMRILCQTVIVIASLCKEKLYVKEREREVSQESACERDKGRGKEREDHVLGSIKAKSPPGRVF